MNAKWLSSTVAAQRLGISSFRLYRLIDCGLLPAYRFGRVIRLKSVDVEALIAGPKESSERAPCGLT